MSALLSAIDRVLASLPPDPEPEPMVCSSIGRVIETPPPAQVDPVKRRMHDIQRAGAALQAEADAEAHRLGGLVGSWRSFKSSLERVEQRVANLKGTVIGWEQELPQTCREAAGRMMGEDPQWWTNAQMLAVATAVVANKEHFFAAADAELEASRESYKRFLKENRADLLKAGLTKEELE